MRSLYWLGCLLLVSVLLPAAAHAQASGAPAGGTGAPLVVWCLDRESGVVRRDLPSACHGTIVSDAEAKAIEARREDEIAHALAPRHPTDALQGLRLASLGTAFYVDSIGDLLTNNHVVAGCKAMQVRSSDHRPVDATVLAVDQVQDLALLHVTAASPAHAIFRSGGAFGLAPEVSAVGYPDEGLPALEPQIVQGKLLRADDGAGHMLISIDVRHGNSGSPIVDSGGLVIGAVRAKLDTAAIYARTGHEIADTGIGVPTPNVLAFLTRNRIRYYVSQGAAPRAEAHLLEQTRAFVARAECWK